MDKKLQIFCFLYNNESPFEYLSDELIDIINSKNMNIINCGANRKQKYDISKINNVINDNTGVNISDKNLYIGEMTGMYWLWKHYEEIGNPEFIGTCHYRRFYKPIDIEDYEKYDVIGIYNKSIFPYSMYNQYCSNKNHDKNLFDFLINQLSYNDKIIAENYFKNSLSIFKQCNMFIMKRDLFMKYCNFIFTMIDKAYEFINPEKTLTNKSDEDKRVISFAIERFTSFWIDYVTLKNRLMIKTLMDIEFYRTKPW